MPGVDMPAPFPFSDKISPLTRELLPWLIGLNRELPSTIAKEFDAARLAEMRRHRLTPLIHMQIMRHHLEGSLSPQVQKFLKHDYYAALQESLLQEQEILRVLRGLGAAGITPILLKGADIRHRLYDDPEVRLMGDLDLLIPRGAVPRAQAALEHLGYTLPGNGVDLRPGFRPRFRAALHFEPASGATITVDLHWHIEAVANFYRLPYQRLSETAVCREFAGVPVKVLSPEHLLIHLCLHTYDELQHALQIVDLGLSLTRLPMNWRHLQEAAVLLKCQAPLYLMLAKLERLFPQTVPSEVLTVLSQYHPSFWERMALDQRFNNLFRLVAPLYHHRQPGDWARYFAALLWPHPDYLTVAYAERGRAAYLLQALARFSLFVKKGGPRN